jgi:hypothetical protein
MSRPKAASPTALTMMLHTAKNSPPASERNESLIITSSLVGARQLGESGLAPVTKNSLSQAESSE